MTRLIFHCLYLPLLASLMGISASASLLRAQPPQQQGPTVIDFEALNTTGPGQGGQIVVDRQYESRGVVFNSPRALDYSKGLGAPGFPHSGSNAIEHCYAGEFCRTSFTFTFTRPQTRVKAWVGYRGSLDQAQVVVLKAFDSQGALVRTNQVTLQARQNGRLIQTPLEVSMDQPHISRAEVGFAADNVFSAGLALDDLEFESRVAPPPLVGQLEIDISNEAGSRDEAGAFVSKEVFQVGDGGDRRENELIYRLIITNRSAVYSLVTNVQAVVRVAPFGIIQYHAVVSGFPTDGSVVGESEGTGFTWMIGTLNRGEPAEIQFRAEAVGVGEGINRVEVSGDQFDGSGNQLTGAAVSEKRTQVETVPSDSRDPRKVTPPPPDGIPWLLVLGAAGLLSLAAMAVRAQQKRRRKNRRSEARVIVRAVRHPLSATVKAPPNPVETEIRLRLKRSDVELRISARTMEGIVKPRKSYPEFEQEASEHG